MPAAIMLSLAVSRPEVSALGQLNVSPGAAPVGTVVLGLLALLVAITSLTVTIALLDPRRREPCYGRPSRPPGRLRLDRLAYVRAGTTLVPPLRPQWQDLGLRHPAPSRIERGRWLLSLAPRRRIGPLLPSLPLLRLIQWIPAVVRPTARPRGTRGDPPRRAVRSVGSSRPVPSAPPSRPRGSRRPARSARAARIARPSGPTRSPRLPRLPGSARPARPARPALPSPQRAVPRSSTSRYRRMACVAEPSLTSPRRASSVRTATAIHGPSTRKCRRRAARVSDRPKPSVPNDE
jgi:hypothetical protein